MKKVLLAICFISAVLFTANAQDKKAEREAAALAAFEKALATVESKDFVIIVGTYQTEGVFSDNTDNANFLAFENDHIILQGAIIADNNNTNKLAVSDYNQTTDKKGNVRISFQAKGLLINARVEISLKKNAGDVADVIITPTKGEVKRFNGEVVPKAQSKYFRRVGEI
jgi:NAD(P)H-hydrate repair Nnr-like enzyme with NAD(P)H-hydrate dehydratase domain